MRNVVLKVLPGLGATKGAQCVFRCVVERELGALTQDQIDVDTGILVKRIGISDVLPGGLQNTLQTPKQSERQFDYFLITSNVSIFLSDA